MSDEVVGTDARGDLLPWEVENPGPQMVVPVRDRILVRRKKAQTHAGLIEIPEQYQDLPNEGVVVAIGDGRMLSNGTIVPMAVAPGDHVLFGRFVGTEILLNREEFLMLREDDVVAAVRPADPAMKERTQLVFTRETLSMEEVDEDDDEDDDEEEEGEGEGLFTKVRDSKPEEKPEKPEEAE